MAIEEGEVFERETKSFGPEKLRVLKVLPKRMTNYRIVPTPNGSVLCEIIREKPTEKVV